MEGITMPQLLVKELEPMARSERPATVIDAAMRLVLMAFTDQERYGSLEPTAAHSLRVGLQLSRYGATTTTVLGGLCHDLIEDTEVTTDMLTMLFSEEVTRLVLACSLNEKLYRQDERAGNLDLVQRAQAYGPDAVAIKVVDVTDNLQTIQQLPAGWQTEMLWCAEHWLMAAHDHLGSDSPYYHELDQALKVASS
jgi:(p)ppGpp synthase/HD superfamily hydrolase